MDILTRHGDLDFNDHVNNVHYVEWMLECRAGAGSGGGEVTAAMPGEIDIVFRQAAKAGEALVSEFCADGERTLHAIRRPSDGAVLATAAVMAMKEVRA